MHAVWRAMYCMQYDTSCMTWACVHLKREKYLVTGCIALLIPPIIGAIRISMSEFLDLDWSVSQAQDSNKIQSVSNGNLGFGFRFWAQILGSGFGLRFLLSRQDNEGSGMPTEHKLSSYAML